MSDVGDLHYNLKPGVVDRTAQNINRKFRESHGFRSNGVVRSNEDAATNNNHLDQYLTRYAPKDKVEEGLVGFIHSRSLSSNAPVSSLNSMNASSASTSTDGDNAALL